MRSLPFADPGTPPLRGPITLLLWLAREQARVVLVAVAFGVLGFTCSAFQPFLLGRIIDSASASGLSRTTWTWAGIMLGVGLVWIASNAIGHRWDITAWMHAAFRTSQLVTRTVSRSGHNITKELPTGEVVSSVANDTMRIGEVFAIAGQTIGSIATYGIVVVLMLSQSVTLGVVIALGLPVVAAILALLVKPLQKRQKHQRDAQGRLTTLGADTVSGLRILRGIGGEKVFTGRYRTQSQKVREAGVEVAGTQSVLDALQILLPGLFIALVVYLGAVEAIAGRITTGQLVSFYGYAAFLSWPVHLLVQSVNVATKAHVAAGKVVKVLQVVPATGAEQPTAAMPPADVPLIDETTGVTLQPGRVVALVSADPDESAQVAVRMGRFDDEAEAGTPVTLGGVRLVDLDKRELRDRIVVAHATPSLFSGRLAGELDVRDSANREALLRAMHIADAHDVLDSLPDGIEGEIPEKGRSLSGGQRQRVALARALLTDPEILVLVEPTSAVDAHTEARIAQRLTGWRRGRTTLIVTASPLVLDHVDDVIFLDSGRVVAHGTHRELLDLPTTAEGGREAARYRRVVGRSLDEDLDAELDELLSATNTPEGGKA
ncbi:ABC-type multidrug transport system, ATPase and permease component [Promicromonospora umidemergens]|uniref:ABC transporter ATP-binding protein n=1 Tax=Promicromonospora umidemergens TaxID=629679 RepID=A0ABP8Y7R5_9MICO|nr:ABC transporter ATP-binding protein [Promicromonospora umidemergens]MCP2282609.1 ABC-type multidrug transport system, ATPase and permease component [Promicromonospora umidemergens]